MLPTKQEQYRDNGEENGNYYIIVWYIVGAYVSP